MTAKAVTIEDLRQAARRRVPRVIFDYIDGGADAERTLGRNTAVFAEVLFRPHGGVATGLPQVSTSILGAPSALPLVLAPVGSSRMFYPRGEERAAHAAGEAGVPYALSTLSGCRLEDVKSATTGPTWYQLYLVGGREAASAAMERATGAGYTALVVTIDTPVAGSRERDVRNGAPALASGHIGASLPHLGQVLARPRWLWSFLLDGGRMQFPNVVVPGAGPMAYADAGAALAESVVTWADFSWIRERWKGPIVVKGVLTAGDAERALAEGARAVVVSNHGGRQLDDVSSTLRALPEVVAAVRGRAEVYLDGGIRRGSDVVKALCLGAGAVLVGRAYAYGLAAGGEAGVARALEILRADVVRTLQLLGCPSVSALSPEYLELPAGWPKR